MKPLQLLMQRKRVKFFLPYIRPDDKILEVGSGTAWFKRALADAGCNNYRCIDLKAPADIIGDIVQWKSLGLGRIL